MNSTMETKGTSRTFLRTRKRRNKFSIWEEESRWISNRLWTGY